MTTKTTAASATVSTSTDKKENKKMTTKKNTATTPTLPTTAETTTPNASVPTNGTNAASAKTDRRKNRAPLTAEQLAERAKRKIERENRLVELREKVIGEKIAADPTIASKPSELIRVIREAEATAESLLADEIHFARKARASKRGTPVERAQKTLALVVFKLKAKFAKLTDEEFTTAFAAALANPIAPTPKEKVAPVAAS